MGRLPALLLAFPAACAGSASRPEGPPAPPGYRLVYQQDFASEGSLEDFELSDPAAFRWAAEGGGALELFGEPAWQPPHRSPLGIALLRDLSLGDFILEAEVLQTGRDYGHRDLCLFFGFQGPDRFYYAHLATAPDDRAQNVFLVDRADRARVAPVAAQGTDWGRDRWHTLRLERRLQDGSIRVCFDDLERPALAASDQRLGWGRVGFGSFDDTGMLRRLRIWAPAARREPTAPAFGSRTESP